MLPNMVGFEIAIGNKEPFVNPSISADEREGNMENCVLLPIRVILPVRCKVYPGLRACRTEIGKVP